jgi:putative tricarboxylic transport membrane protein
VIGALGVYMRRFGWPRPALLIGFVLAGGAETYLYQAVQFYGWAFVLRPGALIILAITVISVAVGVNYETSVSSEGMAEEAASRTRTAQLVFAGVVAAILAYAIYDASHLTFLGRVFPMSMAAVTGLAALWVVFRTARGGTLAWQDEDAATATASGFWTGREGYLAMIAVVVLGVYLLGFMAGIALFFLAFLLVQAQAGPARAAILTGSALAFLFVLSWAMTLHLPEGLLPEMISAAIAGR